MNNLIEKYKIMLNNKFENIEEIYTLIKELEKIDFNNYSESDLILFLNNSNCKFLDISTGKFVNKLPDDNYSKEIIIKMCETHNKKLIEEHTIELLNTISKLIDEGEDNEIINKIIKETSFSNNDKIRLECASVSPNYILFLNDINNDINKIANTKLKYNYDVENYSKEERQLIKFLEESIKANLIKFTECPVTIDYDSKKRVIISKFFNEDETQVDYVLTKISDKKIVANLIYKLLLESQLTFNEELEPSYWKDILSQNGLQKVIVYKKN